MTTVNTAVKPVKEDVWIPTVCNMCFNQCAIRVHKVDGVVVKIEGNPDSPVGEGRVCGKGATGIMQLYDPNRKTKPMKRTNPKKGFDQDPGWVEISWEEAYSIAASKIKAVIDEDPKNLCCTNMVADNAAILWYIYFFKAILGGEWYCADICGVAIHGMYERLSGTGNSCPDYDLCNYVLQFGTQAGTATRHGFNMTVRRFADARVRGCKLVSVDPIMTAGGEKADMWVPIRPGTDAALALAIAYVMVHELKQYDTEFLIKRTNSPYLVDVATGLFVRHKETGKPYIWDSAANKAKTIDDKTIKETALLGTYTVEGKTCKTGFQTYVEHLKQYTPEFAEKVTTVPAVKTRQIAKELVEAACIGQTITIDGKVLPYRPVAVDAFSGVTRHKNNFHTLWSILQLNVLLGSCNVPGGLIGFAPTSMGNEGTNFPKWSPGLYEQDQMLEYNSLYYVSPRSQYKEYATKSVKHNDKDKGMFGLQPLNVGGDAHFVFNTQLNPERYKQKSPMKLLYNLASNPIKNWGNHDDMAEFLKSFEYIIACDIYLNDSSYFADLFLPEAQYLERYDVPPNASFNHHTIGGLSTPWALSIRQPVVEAKDGAPGSMDIMIELAERLGVLPKLNTFFNMMFKMDDEIKLDVTKKYKFEEVLDHIYKSWAGHDKGLDWFMKNGVLTWPRRLEEVYLYPDHQGRVPLYYEFVLTVKEKLEKALEECQVPWEQVETYTPNPNWYPCLDYEIPKPGYELYPVFYTNAVNVDSWGQTNPWINEINENEPYGYTIVINKQTADAKGLKSGDDIILESVDGIQVKGRLFTSQAIHPEVLGVGGGNFEIKSEYLPIGHKKGSAICHFFDAKDPHRMDHLSAGFDQCIRVKVTKA
ncbi:MAG: molybdopterin-dependent oxidoreductase [Desulfitobacterium sp.]